MFRSLIDWTAKRSGATMTITGFPALDGSPAGPVATITGVVVLESQPTGVFAYTKDGEKIHLLTPSIVTIEETPMT